jgi:hypothetical protein
MFTSFMKEHFAKIHEINAKYRTPRIKMSKPVRVSLFCLRVYLLLLVGLLLYKFVLILL